MKLREMLQDLDGLIPLSLSEPWDSCGLQVGDPDRPVRRVMVCLDVDAQAAQFAEDHQIDLIVSHHPLLFHAVERIDESVPGGHLLARLIRDRIAVYSAHTNLDRMPEGVSTALAACFGFNETTPLIPWDGGLPGAGYGRVGVLSEPESLHTFLKKAEAILKTPAVMRNFKNDAPVSRIAFAGGSFPDEWILSLIEKKTDLLVTGEIGYHDMLELKAYGVHVMAVGHEHSERCVIHPLVRQLRRRFSGQGIEVESFDPYDHPIEGF